MSKHCPQSKTAKTVPFLAGVCNLGHTEGKTGTVSHGLILQGGHNITLKERRHHRECATIKINALDQSIQTQNLFDLTLSGNTSGILALVSSGTLTLAGGDNIVLSQNGNAVTISAAAIGAGSFSAGMSTGGNTSGTSGTVANRVVFAGGNNITLSQSVIGQSATITISGNTTLPAYSAGMSTIGNTTGTTGIASQRLILAGGNNVTLSGSTNAGSMTITIEALTSQQTQNIIRDINIAGNTSGAFADITSGTLSLAGGYNITLSQNANSITISGPDSLIGGMTTLGNTAGDNTLPIRMESLILVGGNNITLSQSTFNEFATVTFNAQSQSAQTDNIINDVNIIGQTSGTTADITSGTLFLAGGNNITLSQVGNSITISGASDTMTNFSAGVSSLGNTSGTTGTVHGQVVFAGGNSITLSQSVVGQSATIFISGPTETVSQYSAGMSTIGNTTGTTGIASQRLILAGGNNIILSGSTNAGSMTITIEASPETVSLFSAGVSSLGNTAGTTGTVDNQLIFVGGNNITLSQSTIGQLATVTINALDQSIQTQNIINDVNIAGNTTGITADITSGTLTLAGGNNIVLSQNGNAITISAAAIGAGSFSAGVSTGGNTLGATGTVANQLVFVGSDNVTLSQNKVGQSATITISIAAVGAGSFSAGVSDIGHTSGDTGTVANQLVFAGGNNITLSQSTIGQSATITISAFDQSIQTQSIINDVNIIGNTSGTTADITSGTLFLAGGNGIILSQVGNSITISEHGLSAGMPNLGNTDGTTGFVHDQLAFVGGDNIILSQSINGESATITISASADTVTQFSAGVSNSGNFAGITGTVDNQMVFIGGSNITLSQSIDILNHSGTITINAFSDTVTQFSAGVSNSGNFSGITGTVDNQIAFIGGNNITLSQSIDILNHSGTITISAFNQTTQTQNLIDVTLAGHTSGTSTLVSSGTLTLAGGNNITLSQSGNAVTISAFDQTTQTQNLIDVTVSGNTSGTLALISSGTLTLAGGNGIILSQVGNAITISEHGLSAGMPNLGNTDGTTGFVHDQLAFVGGSNITLSQSIDILNHSGTITINAFSETNTQFSAGVSNSGNFTGTTGTVDNQIVFVGGSNITLSQSIDVLNHSGTITINAQNVVDVTLSGNTTGTSTLISSGIMTIAGGNNITLSQVGNAVTVSAFNQTTQTQNLIDVTLASNTSGTLALISSGTLTLAGGNNITLSQVGNAVTVSAFNQTTQTQNLIDVTLSGNTSGTLALISSGTLTLAGGNNITLSQVGNAVTVSAFNQTTQTQNLIDVTLSGNTSGTLALISSGTLTLAGGNNITLSQVGNAVTISGLDAATVPILSKWDNILDVAEEAAVTALAVESRTFWLVDMNPYNQVFPGNMTVSTAFLDVAATANSSGSNAHTWQVGIYTRNASTLSLLNSVSTTWSFSANTSNTQLFSGTRFVPIQSSQWSLAPTFSQTQYYMGFLASSAGAIIGMSMIGHQILPNAQRSGTIGVSTATGNTSMGWVPYVGVSTVTRSNLPTSVQLSELVKSGSFYAFIPHMVFFNMSGAF